MYKSLVLKIMYKLLVLKIMYKLLVQRILTWSYKCLQID